MLQTILNYKFSDLSLSNPDGSKPAQVRNCSLGNGPGSISGWGSFPSSFVFGGNSSVKIPIAKEEFDMKQFSIRMIFKLTAAPTARINLIESATLPMAIFLMPGSNANKFYLQASFNTKSYGWTSATTKFDYEMTLGDWVKLEVVYDLDTVMVKIDGRSRVIYAFPDGELKPGTGSQTFIGTWVDGARYAMTGEVAFLELNKGISASLESQLDSQRNTSAWHVSYKYQDFKKDRNLGNPKSKITYASGSYYQDFDHGKIMYHPSFGAFAMYGMILDRFNSLTSTKKSELGPLLSDEMAGRRAGVRMSSFKNGAIYWSSGTGAFPVVGQMYVDYENMDAEQSVMGLPVSLYSTTSGGRFQVFQGGRMYYKNGAAKAFEVHGSILSRYLALGGPSKKGFPITNEMDVRNGSSVIGKVSEFEGCDIYWSGSTGAFEIYGAIRAKYDEMGGPLSQLGFPTSNESNVPGASGARMNTFKNGSIVWFPTRGAIVCYPFEIYLDRVSVRDADDDILWKDDSDIYAKIVVKENGHQIHSSVKPNSGTYSNTTEANLKYAIPRMITPNQINQTIDFEFQGWDSDDGRPFSGGDDNLGFYSKRLNAANAWGLIDNNGIFNRAGGSRGLKLDWSVRPKIKQGSMSDRDFYFWGQANQGTTSISWDTYADAFRDVTKGVNFFDHVSLKSLFYELVVKGVAAGGNCFGMSLEGIYAMKCMSRFGKPLNRFTWNQTEREFNIKHQYQVGASAIWWFVSQFITGNTHDPKRVFNDTQYYNSIGNKPVICISQNYDFSGAPHCIFPWKWSKSGDIWKIECFDPNITTGSRTIEINSRTNTYSYNNGRAYSGGAWSGGRLHYMPWYILCDAPRTPIWDVILLILAGTVLIFADSGETVTLTDASGKNIDGGKIKESENTLRSKMFVPFHGLDGRVGSNLMLQKGQGLSNAMTHVIRGKKAGQFSYGIANLNGELRYNTNFRQGELETFKANKLGALDNEISILSKESKLYDLEFNQKIGDEIVRTKIDKLPTDKDKELLFSIQPGVKGVDVVSSGGSTDARISTEIYDKNNKLKKRFDYNLNIEGALRLRNSSILSTGVLSTSKIERLGGNVIDIKTILPR